MMFVDFVGETVATRVEQRLLEQLDQNAWNLGQG